MSFQFCSTPNETYSVLNFDNENSYIKNNNQLAGILGEKFDRLMIKLSKRKCTLIGYPILGEKLENGTYTGNLGTIQDGRSIVYLKPEARLLDEEWMSYTHPFFQEKYYLNFFKEIPKSYKDELKINNLMRNLNVNNLFTTIFILSSLLFFFALIALKVSSKKNGKSIFQKIKSVLKRKLLYNQWTLVSDRSKIGIFVSLFSIYFWFIQNFIMMNIKTEKVIVDTSILIKTEEDALKTDLLFCFIDGETELSIALNSKINILRKMYEQKALITKPVKNLISSEKNRCIIKKDIKNYSIETSEFFMIISETAFYIVASIMKDAKTNSIAWIMSKPIFETGYHLTVKNKREIVEKFNHMVLVQSQSGFEMPFVNAFRIQAIPVYLRNTVYSTLEEFIDDMVKFDKLSLGNFKVLFVTYFSFCSILLIINFAHLFLIASKSNQQIFRFRNSFRLVRN